MKRNTKTAQNIFQTENFFFPSPDDFYFSAFRSAEFSIEKKD